MVSLSRLKVLQENYLYTIFSYKMHFHQQQSNTETQHDMVERPAAKFITVQVELGLRHYII